MSRGTLSGRKVFRSVLLPAEIEVAISELAQRMKTSVNDLLVEQLKVLLAKNDKAPSPRRNNLAITGAKK